LQQLPHMLREKLRPLSNTWASSHRAEVVELELELSWS
jgi:hypothetical protein